jgi:hypothetical protein
MLLTLQKPFRIDGGHAAGSGSRDRLAVNMILHIAAGKDPGHVSPCSVVGYDVTIGIQFQLADK